MKIPLKPSICCKYTRALLFHNFQPSIDIVDLVRQIFRVLERHQTLGQRVQAPGTSYGKSVS